MPALWRTWVYTATGAPLGAVALVLLLVLTLAGMALTPVVIGLGLLVAVGLLGIPFGAVERRRLRLLGLPAEPSPHRTVSAGLVARARIRLGEAATWRSLAFTLLLGTGLWLLDFVLAAISVVAAVLLSSPVVFLVAGPVTLVGVRLLDVPTVVWIALCALLVLVASLYATRLLARLHVAAVRALLVAPVPSEALVPVPSQGRLLDAFDAERARIERDLHDGTQQRLVALSVMLDVARMRAGDEPTRELLTKAHREATATLVELRELVQGIHPHVLTSRGLRAAVTELVASHPLVVDARIDVSGRLPSSVESTAFFVISEALANVAKHSGASRASVSATVVRDVLQVEVVDSGRGGASLAGGSGVQGVADRVSAVGGVVLLSSPVGGPTVLRAEIPCGAR